MSIDEQLAKMLLDDLVPRYMKNGIFDGQPDRALTRELFRDLVEFSKSARVCERQRLAEETPKAPTKRPRAKRKATRNVNA